jgi:hypothetical protein
MNDSTFAWELRRAIVQTVEAASLYEGEAALIRHARKRSLLLYVTGKLGNIQTKLERLARNERIALPDRNSVRQRNRLPSWGGESQACFAYLSLEDIVNVVTGRCAQMRTYYSRRREQEQDHQTRLLCGAMARAFGRLSLLVAHASRRLTANRRLEELPPSTAEAAPIPSLQA